MGLGVYVPVESAQRKVAEVESAEAEESRERERVARTGAWISSDGIGKGRGRMVL